MIPIPPVNVDNHVTLQNEYNVLIPDPKESRNGHHPERTRSMTSYLKPISSIIDDSLAIIEPAIQDIHPSARNYKI